MGSRATRFRKGMVFGSTTPTLVVTRSCHSFMAGARRMAHTTRPFTMRLLTTIQDQAAIARDTVGPVGMDTPIPPAERLPVAVPPPEAVPVLAVVILIRRVETAADRLHVLSSRE